MARDHADGVLRYVRRIIDTRCTSEIPDTQLLQAFLAQHDEAAFAALVHRHGPMVLGVCQRLLRDPHEAEDGFQATFVVLLRKAPSLVNCVMLGNWLYGVAYRVALKMRSAASRRLAREGQGKDMDQPAPSHGVDWHDLRPVIDDALQRLPRKYRAPIVLCYLEGKTNEEAARILRWPSGTVKGRLARARELLRLLLARRGLVLTSTGLVAALAENAAAAVPPQLVDRLVNVAGLTGQRSLAELVSPQVFQAAEGVLQAMILMKLKVAAALLVAGIAAVVMLQYAGIALPAGKAAAVQVPTGLNNAPEEVGTRAPPAPPRPDLSAAWKDLAGTEETKVLHAVVVLASAPPKEAAAFLKEHLLPVKAEPGRMARLLSDLDHKDPAARQAAQEHLEYLGKSSRSYLRQALEAKPAPQARHLIEGLLTRIPYDPFDEMDDLFSQLRKQPESRPIRDKLIELLRCESFDERAQLEHLNQLFDAEKKKLVLDRARLDELGGLILTIGQNLNAPIKAPIQIPEEYRLRKASPPVSPLWLRAKRAIALLEHIGTPEARQVLQRLATGDAQALPTREASTALERLTPAARR
jgi:RNA polymerase sigma factor (sigma-70 family)